MMIGYVTIGATDEAKAQRFYDAVFGEMGRETVLSSQNVRPEKLLGAGFAFTHPRLPETLAALLAR